MNAVLPTHATRLLVFTDLDGSLLDHDDYSFAAAQPALDLLRHRQIPLIPTTSKTLAEMQALQSALRNTHPFIVENGSAICIPRDYFVEPKHAASAHAEYAHDYRLLRLAPPYAQVIAVLRKLRADHGFHFRGFNDMSAAEVARDTGLSVDDAARARERLCTEPLLWRDDKAAFEQFSTELAAAGFRLLRGGRYWHVLSNADKAAAMRQLTALYEAADHCVYTTVALGDSPNDIAMLNAADIAVVIRQKNGSAMNFDSHKHCIITEQAGPAGWNEAMIRILHELSTATTAT
jgi:mannosyl-3-phosphoglycerate phosphatase